MASSAGIDFYGIEDRDGARFSWNVWPASRTEANRVVVPLGCLYSPFKQTAYHTVVNYEPVMCKGQNCHTVLNPHCVVDIPSKQWMCQFCYQRNPFPPHYSGITETNLPAELIPSLTTIEYMLPRAVARPPVFLFVVDTCMLKEDIEPLKQTLLMALSLLPENSLVGLITFGTTVQVHELAHEICPKSYVFHGEGKDLNPKRLEQLLGFASPSQPGQPGQPSAPAPAVSAQKRFLVDLSECEMTLEMIFEELQPDPHPIKAGERGRRSTGVAMSVAVSLLENTCPNSPARIMAFLAGPCTQGPGQVVGLSLKEEYMRSHHDIAHDKAKYLSKSSKFYDELAARTARNGHAVDIFAVSLDQVGLLEMQNLFKRTGGVTVLADSMDSPMFTESFRKMFEKTDQGELKMGFNAALQIQVCKELKINGAIGHCASLNKKSSNVAETEIGVGGTSAWRLCSLDPNSTIAFYFDVVNQPTTPIAHGQKGVIQFQTHYQNSQGRQILRVTTVAHYWADPNAGTPGLAVGFDQEAAAVLMARIAAYKAETQDSGDVMRWLDRSLVRLCNKFAAFHKDDPNSFQLGPAFALYPQFMFHLRRSSLLQVFNCSPDETCFIRSMAIRETVSNVLLMMQPTLEAYVMGRPPFPVLLSATSMMSDRILVLDSFFQVVVWVGSNIAEWRNQGYHHDPNYAHLKAILEAPKAYIEMVKKTRFPYPRLVEADQGTSQARFVAAVVDPAVTHSTPPSGGGVEAIMTDDVNLDVFMEHLKKLAIQA